METPHIMTTLRNKLAPHCLYLNPIYLNLISNDYVSQESDCTGERYTSQGCHKASLFPGPE